MRVCEETVAPAIGDRTIVSLVLLSDTLRRFKYVVGHWVSWLDLGLDAMIDIVRIISKTPLQPDRPTEEASPAWLPERDNA